MDHHLILDLITPLAHAYFCGRLPAALSYSQAAILTCVGLQQHEIGRVRAGCWDAAVLCCAGLLGACIGFHAGTSSAGATVHAATNLTQPHPHAPLAPVCLPACLQLEETLGLPPSQALALFNKAVRRLHGLLRSAKEAEVERSLPKPTAAARGAALVPHAQELDAELDEAAQVGAGAGAATCGCFYLWLGLGWAGGTVLGWG